LLFNQTLGIADSHWSLYAVGQILGEGQDGSAAILLHFVVGAGIPYFFCFSCGFPYRPAGIPIHSGGNFPLRSVRLSNSFFPPLPPGFWPFVGSLIRLSFTALGAYIAIAITANVREAKYPKKTGGVKYSIPVFLTGMALVSIPIIYVDLVLSFFIALG